MPAAKSRKPKAHLFHHEHEKSLCCYAYRAKAEGEPEGEARCGECRRMAERGDFVPRHQTRSYTVRRT